MKYTGLAFQMAGLVFVSIFLGGWIDDKLNLSAPYFTILLLLFLFGGFMYKLYLDLIKK